MTNETMNLPIVAQTQDGTWESERAMKEIFEQRFITRLSEERDFGVDGSIELKSLIPNTLNYYATGRRAWFQLKHTSSSKRLKDNSISYQIETKNLNYLQNYACPFYILYFQPSKELYFRWWRDIRDELSRVNPAWNKQEFVTVKFSRLVDHQILSEIELEIETYTDQAVLLFDGPNFVRFVNSERAKRLLQPDNVFIGREQEFEHFKQRITRGTVVPVKGMPDAGKSELVRQFLVNPTSLHYLEKHLGSPLSLVIVDVGVHLAPRLLRSLAYSLGVHKFREPELADFNVMNHERALLLGQDWPMRVQGQHVLVIVENAHLLTETAEQNSLENFLSTEPFRSGCAVVVSRWGDVNVDKGFRIREVDVDVGSLLPSEATTLLTELLLDDHLVSITIDTIQEIPELLLPGVLRRGASTFKIGVSEGRFGYESDRLIDELFAATEYLAEEVLKRMDCCTFNAPSGAITPLVTILAMSVLGRIYPWSEDFDSLVLPEPPFYILQKAGWAILVEDNYQLTGIGCRTLRRELIRFNEREGATIDVISLVADRVGYIVTKVSDRIGETCYDDFAKNMEEAIAWVRESGLAETTLEARLIQKLLPFIVDHVFFPITSDSVVAIQGEVNDVGQANRLPSAIADLVIAVRSNFTADDFLSRLQNAVHVAVETPSLLPIFLRALDISAFIGLQRYQRPREIYSIRTLLIPRLICVNNSERIDAASLKWAASWILNTAYVASKIGNNEMTTDILKLAESAVGRLPDPKAAYALNDFLTLKLRLAKIQFRLLTKRFDCVAKLREILAIALKGFANSPNEQRWLISATRCANSVAAELYTDEERYQLVNNLIADVSDVSGDLSTWPLMIRGPIAASLRNIARNNIDDSNRLKLVLKAIDLLRPKSAEAITMAHLGDSRFLLVLARTLDFAAVCYKNLGETDKSSKCWYDSEHFFQEALKANPSAYAWKTYLKFIGQIENQGLSSDSHSDFFAKDNLVIGPQLKKNLALAREWLESRLHWTIEEGRLALWCLQCDWQSQGNLERVAIVTQSVNVSWESLNKERKQGVLSRKNLKRQADLDVIERKSGPFFEIHLARIRQEAQYQRLKAIYSNHKLDSAKVDLYFKNAKELWPDNPYILLEEGRFYRYVWDYPRAISSLRNVVAVTLNGYIRKQATIDLVEVLLTAAEHCEVIKFDNRGCIDQASLINEAMLLIESLEAFRELSMNTALLRDRVHLESGCPINWDDVDKTFTMVIGDIDAYATTLINHFELLHNYNPGLALHIADVVKKRCTSTDALRNMGKLYLRGAQLAVSPNVVSDLCRKAYAVFLACRVLEKAWSNNQSESPTTCYHRGMAILVAAKASGNLTPFDAPLEDKKNLVHLADTLFSRAVGLTIGLFHAENKKCQSEATLLWQRRN